jgi:hypothetical protein
MGLFLAIVLKIYRSSQPRAVKIFSKKPEGTIYEDRYYDSLRIQKEFAYILSLGGCDLMLAILFIVVSLFSRSTISIYGGRLLLIYSLPDSL